MSSLDNPLLMLERFGIARAKPLFQYPFIERHVRKLPYGFAKKKLAIALEEIAGRLIVAMVNPLDLEAIEEIRAIAGMPLEELYASQEEIERAIEHCYHQAEEEASEFIKTLVSQGEESEISDDGYDLLEQQSDSPVIRMVNAILTEAIQQRASDIHFEPYEQRLVARYRIDGVLQQRHVVGKEFQNQLLTRIKVLAKLDIAEHRLPQDGRIKLRLGGREIDFRVSTVPIVHGERIVLRILDRSHIVVGLDQIGMSAALLKQFRRHMAQTQGIILVTGPTGSGKTTTLYSAISEINSEEINVMTVEDPVEYKIPGLAQIGVNPKIHLTFAVGLRHILRQDPDVIMIGEIRDIETAEIAIQASLTGHLVVSTLHTNDAPSAIARLVDMGIEPYLLSSSLIAVLAQRLVRVICPACRYSYTPSASELKDLGVDTETLWQGKGCEKCFGSGYKGRVGIYELMTLSAPIKQELLKHVDANTLQRIALENGMRTLRTEGAALAVAGVTSSAEVFRVTRSLVDE